MYKRCHSQHSCCQCRFVSSELMRRSPSDLGRRRSQFEPSRSGPSLLVFQKSTLRGPSPSAQPKASHELHRCYFRSLCSPVRRTSRKSFIASRFGFWGELSSKKSKWNRRNQDTTGARAVDLHHDDASESPLTTQI